MQEINTKYKGKKFSILGDSISTLKGVSLPELAVFYEETNMLKSGVYSKEYTWWWQVINNLQGELLINNSFSGSTVTWHPDYEIQSYGCSDERTSSLAGANNTPDVIMVYLGTNDWGAGRKVTSFDESDMLVFSNAYKNMLEKLKKNYPLAEIWCFTLATSKWSANEDFSFPKCYSGRSIDEYTNAIKKCAVSCGAKVIDLTCAPLYDTIDGFHPNADGMKTLADVVTSLALKL